MINEKQLKKYCSEDIAKIENYDLAINDDTQTWCCHHRREIDENKSKSQLIAEKLYYHRPASELIFMPKREHIKIHNIRERNPMFGKCGEKSCWFGKRHSAESIKKMSILHSGERNPMFGKSPWNKGKHLSDETKKKCAEAIKGTHWWNNGIVSKQKRECPGEGWVRGRLKRNNHK